MAPINAVLSVSESEDLYPYETEPVSVPEVKAYAKIDFNDDDTLIETLITAARILLEAYTGLSFIPKTLTVQLHNYCGGIELPYGPLNGDIDTSLITNYDGQVVELDIRGQEFVNIETKINWVQLIYSVGYTTLPQQLKTALKAQVFFMYENRGEVMGGDYIATEAQLYCKKFRRVWDAMF